MTHFSLQANGIITCQVGDLRYLEITYKWDFSPESKQRNQGKIITLYSPYSHTSLNTKPAAVLASAPINNVT